MRNQQNLRDLDSQLYYQKPQYLVAWNRFATPTWEPASMVNEAAAVELF
jgi:hypothetical protein